MKKLKMMMRNCKNKKALAIFASVMLVMCCLSPLSLSAYTQNERFKNNNNAREMFDSNFGMTIDGALDKDPEAAEEDSDGKDKDNDDDDDGVDDKDNDNDNDDKDEDEEDAEDTEEGQLYKSLLSGLSDIIPDEAAKQLPDTLLSSLETDTSVSEAASLDVEFFLKASAKLLKALLPETLKQAVSIIGIVICTSVLRAAKDGAIDDSVSHVLDLVSCLCILLYSYEILSGIWNTVYNTLYAIDVFMKSLVPMMTAVYACLGGLTSSAVNSGGLALVIALFEEITSSVLYPVLRVSLGFTVVSSFTDSVDLSGIISFVKKLFIVVLSFIMALFTAIMSYQSVLAQSADTLVSRTVKFAAGSMIPVIGGALSEAAGNVVSSVSLIKSTMGTVSMAVILLLALSPVISILLNKVGFGLASVASKALGCSKEGKLIDDINGILDLALALTASCVVMFILALSIFTKMSAA